MDEITPAPTADEVTQETADDFEDLLAFAERHRENPAFRGLAKACEALLHLNEEGFFAPIHEAIAAAEERYARAMAGGLRGIDLDDRFPKGDENGIIHAR